MSTRDELAKALDLELAESENWESYGGCLGLTVGTTERIADALIAEGWRKVPSRDEVLSALSNARRNWQDTITADAEVQWLTDAILALMDGGQ